MRRCLRFVVLPVFILALLWSGAVAQAAAPLIGISQSYRDFGLKTTRSQNYEASHDVSKSTAWRDVGANTLRVIVPWDIALRPASDGIRREFQNWINRARASDVSADPYVVFGPTNSPTNLANPSQVTHRTAPDGPVAPFAGDYRTAITAFLMTWGPKTAAGIRMIGAWNEPNLKEVDMSIPNPYDGPIFLPKSGGATTTWMSSLANCPSGATTSNCGPLMAAHYWKNANEVMNLACQGSGKDCYVVAGEFDSTPTASNYWNTYANKLQDIAPLPTIISFHAHRDAHPLGEHTNASLTVDHDCRPGNEGWCVTARFYNWLKNRKDGWSDRTKMRIWSTEVGVEYRGGYSTWEPNSEQWNRFNDLLAISEKYRVKRMYYFNFQGSGVTDRGLIDKGSTVNTATRKIWGKIRSMQCPGGCSSPRAIAAVVTPEESYEEPPELPAEGEEADSPPTATTEPATDVQKTKARLNGVVHPEGSETAYYFEYGTTEAYGTMMPSPPWAMSGSAGATPVTMPISGLRPGTEYHYRMVAKNIGGTSYGADRSFTTKPVSRESDVNGDGRSDLVTLGTNGNAYVYPGQANGYLGAGVSAGGGSLDPAQADGSGYYPIDVEDVDGDGHDDLVSMHSSGTVYTFLGQANVGQTTGTFGPMIGSLNNGLVPSILNPAPGEYEPVAVADTTGDGRGDLVVFNNLDETVYTYPGQANGQFSSARVASLAGAVESAHFDSSGSYFLDVADVDGDSLADLVTHVTNGEVRVHKATGSGGFQNVPYPPLANMPPSMRTGAGHEPIAVADVNGDGFGDLVTHNSANGIVSTYLGQISGAFGARVDTPGAIDSDLFDGIGSELGTAIDVNGDSYADLVTAKRADGNVYVLQGQPDGSFGAATTNFGGAYASTRVNRKQGMQMAMEKPIRRRDGCQPTGCGIDPRSDVNGDHRADLLALQASGTVQTYPGQPAGILGNPVASQSGALDPAQYDRVGYYPLGVEDINADGYDDLVSMHSSGTVYTFLGQANGSVGPAVTSLTQALAPSVHAPAGGEFEPIGVGDTNGDRRGDLVLFNNYERAVYTYPGQANGGFSNVPAVSITLASGTGNGDSALFDSYGDYFLDVADVDGDELADLVAQNTNGSAHTYRATGAGGFDSTPVSSFAGTLSTSLATGSGREPVAVSDVNGDGRADYVVGSTVGVVSVFLGQANGAFATRVDTSESFDSNLYDGVGVELGTVIDVSGDGFGDLVWTKDNGVLYVQKGRRNGSFGPAQADLAGNYSSSRHNRGSGSQMINEQPLRRRSACAWNGCGMDLGSDVNGDHRADLVTLHTSGSAYTYLGQPGGDFAAGKASSMTLASGSNGVLDPAQYDGFGYYPLGVEDINGDRLDDFVTLDSEGTATVYTGQLDGGFSGAEIDSLIGELPPAILAPSPGKYEPVGLGDATGDGRGDLVVFNHHDKTVYTYPGQASGQFSTTRVASLTLASGTGTGDSALFDRAGDYFLGVADVTGDGLADLVAHGTDGYLRTYKATGWGGFETSPVTSLSGSVSPSLATGAGYEPIAVADVNGDGRADLVVHHASGTIYTYLGQASGSFSYNLASSGYVDSNLYDGVGWELGTVIDLNGDGYGDLLSADPGDGNVYVRLGKRNGTFGFASAQLAGYVSTRHSQGNGEQMVTEQPLRRRSACAANGCY